MSPRSTSCARRCRIYWRGATQEHESPPRGEWTRAIVRLLERRRAEPVDRALPFRAPLRISELVSPTKASNQGPVLLLEPLLVLDAALELALDPELVLDPELDEELALDEELVPPPVKQLPIEGDFAGASHEGL